MSLDTAIPARHLLLAAALALAGGGARAESACGPETTVEAGDTLQIIAERCDVAVEAIVKANPELDPNRLAAGQTLRLDDGEADSGADAEIYRVRPGDSLTRIAETFGATEDAVRAANPDLDAADLHVGQEIQRPRPAETGLEIGGVLTDEGGACQAMRGLDDALYSLTGDLAGYRSGDIVEVRGIAAKDGACSRGRTIEVKTIAAVE